VHVTPHANQLSNGRSICLLNVIDHFNCEAMHIEIGFSLPPGPPSSARLSQSSTGEITLADPQPRNSDQQHCFKEA